MFIELSKGIRYSVDSPSNCEYAKEMTKVYSKLPKIDELGCRGYCNKYTKAVSKVCIRCCFYVTDSTQTMETSNE